MIAAFAMATIRFARIAQGFPMEIPLLMNAASAMIIQKMIAFRIALGIMEALPMLTSAASAMTPQKMIASRIAMASGAAML